MLLESGWDGGRGCGYNERVELNRRPKRRKGNKKILREKDKDPSHREKKNTVGEKVALNRRGS